MSNINLSIVVLSYNRLEEIKKNVTSICKEIKSEGLYFEVIVVDNASDDGSQQFLRDLEKRYSFLSVLLNNENYGVAKGRNIGYKKAKGNYILSIDDDTKIGIDEIQKLKAELTELPEAGILSPHIKHYKTKQNQSYHGEEVTQIANFHGACYLIKRKVFEEVGYLDEECTFGGEELDYSIRSYNKGFKILYTPNIIVYHNNYRRTGDEGAERRYKWVYNFIRIHFKHFPFLIAVKFSFRYLVSHIFNSLKKNNITASISLCAAAVKGGLIGFEMNGTVSAETTAFYSNENLRPDFGNVPLYQKIKS